MDWEEDALGAISKAPALLRGMVRKKVEGYVRQKGRTVVTLADVSEARDLAMRGRARAAREGAEPDEYGGLSAEEIERIVTETKTAVTSNSRFYEVKVCGGAFGCPRALFDVQDLADRIIERIEASGLPEAVQARVRPPILRHHKFTVAVAGCPNSCSQPQIQDFGVQGRARVGLGSGSCTQCMACVRICSEGCIVVDRSGPEIDRGACIDCGDCAMVCPSETLVVQERGFTALIGGKLGRHPQLAREIAWFCDEQALLGALDSAMDIFMNHMQSGERLADAVTRIGIQAIRERLSV